jgi:hypothetical protein
LLNEHAKIAEGAISDKHTQYASSVLRPRAVGFRELADGSVTQAKLADGSVTQAKLGVDLRTGWVRMAFKPVPWDGKEQFRLGPTEARSTEKGAGGSMGVPVPPGVTDVTRLRIAGELNEGTIRLALYRCGWDEEEHDHEKTPLFGEKDGIKEIVGETPARSFEHTMKIDDLNKRRLHAEYHALSVVIEATKKASISLIAVEFGYSSS